MAVVLSSTKSHGKKPWITSTILRRKIMESTKQILSVLVWLTLCAPFVAAQDTQSSKPSPEAASREVTIIIQQKQLRFSTPVPVEALRLEVFSKAGDMVYDSG